MIERRRAVWYKTMGLRNKGKRDVVFLVCVVFSSLWSLALSKRHRQSLVILSDLQEQQHNALLYTNGVVIHPVENSKNSVIEYQGNSNFGIKLEKSQFFDCSNADTIELRTRNKTDSISITMALSDSYDCLTSNATDCSSEWFFSGAQTLGDISTFLLPESFHTNQIEDSFLHIGNIQEVRVDISANHNGSFTFEKILCSGNDMFGSQLLAPSKPESPWEYMPGSDTEENTIISDSNADLFQYDYDAISAHSWGGFTALQYWAPASSYFDLSNATMISFKYNIIQAQSYPSSAHFRLILRDSSDCENYCSAANVESYFSFHDILDNKQGWNTISIPLTGNTDPAQSFYNPGWTGIFGNGVLDKDRIKGIQLEISIAPVGGLGSRSSGSMMITELMAVGSNTNESYGVESCKDEPGIMLLSDPEQYFPYGSRGCCERCEQLPNCAFTRTNGVDCALFLSESTNRLSLANSRSARFRMTTHIPARPICTICNCTLNKIDCSYRNLTSMPSYDEDESYASIQTLDISGNPGLMIVPTSSLGALINLREINATGSNVIYLGVVPKSTRVIDLNTTKTKNLISYEDPSSKIFSDICCQPDSSNLTTTSGHKLGYCGKVEDDRSGADCIFEEFIEYQDELGSMQMITGSSLFGALSTKPEYCAEMCERTYGCTHFTWDGRDSLAEPICYLKKNDKGRRFVNDTISETKGPAYVSGYCSHYRRSQLNSIPIFSKSKFTVKTKFANQTQYFNYSVKLSSKPTRGAVWIRPLIKHISVVRDVVIKIFPRQLVIFPEEWSEEQDFTIMVNPKTTTGSHKFEIHHPTQACDKSFHNIDMRHLVSEVEVILPKPKENRNYSPEIVAVCRSLAVINILLASCFTIWTIRYRAHPIGKAAQPIFLTMISVGAVVSSATIFFLTVTDEGIDTKRSYEGTYSAGNNACMLRVWLYSIGFVITFAPLMAKTHRVHKIFNSGKRIKVKTSKLLLICALILFVDVCIIITWSVFAPYRFRRVALVYDDVGNPTESIALCKTEEGADSTPFVVAVTLVHVSLLVYANYLCYRVKNLSNTPLSEGKYVQLSCFSNIQIIFIAGPVLLIAADSPNAYMFLSSGIIFLNDFSTQCLIFVPKIWAWYTGRFRILPTPEEMNGEGNRGMTLNERDFTKITENDSDKGGFVVNSFGQKTDLDSSTKKTDLDSSRGPSVILLPPTMPSN